MAERDRGTGKEKETGAGQEAMPSQRPERTHESGYGGKAGEPKTSSDEREPLEPTGKENRD